MLDEQGCLAKESNRILCWRHHSHRELSFVCRFIITNNCLSTNSDALPDRVRARALGYESAESLESRRTVVKRPPRRPPLGLQQREQCEQISIWRSAVAKPCPVLQRRRCSATAARACQGYPPLGKLDRSRRVITRQATGCVALASRKPGGSRARAPARVS
jgi:hypothetical protein